MAQPTIYTPAYNFSSYQSTHPTDPLPAGSVDNELYLIATSIAQICNNLGIIQRDDGALANNSVGAAQLEAALNIGLNYTSPWVTAHAYIANNFVYGPDNDVYQCLVSHTSGVFATDLANGKWTKVLSFATATNAATAAGVSASAANASAVASAASAVDAAASAAKLTGTSTTSNTIGTGAKSFTTQSGKLFPVGGSLNITSDANPTVNNMYGTVTSYSGTALVMNITVINGAGTLTDWTITLAGARGATGATGAPGAGTGDMLKANNLSELPNFATARTNLGLGSAALQANSFFAQAANNGSDFANAATFRTNLAVMGTAANLSDVANNVTALANLFGATPVIPSGATGTTQATNDSSTKLATTAYVKAQPIPTMTAFGVGALVMASFATDSDSGSIQTLNAGSTIAGSRVRPQSADTAAAATNRIGAATDGAPSGTWLALQTAKSGPVASSQPIGPVTLWQRVA